MSRVVIVDDHPVFRRGLAALLAAGGHDVVGEAASAAEALDVVGATGPDVVVMDLGLPDQHGVVATARITARHPSIRIVVVTAFDDPATVRAALDAGAIGYVVKDAAAAQILTAVQAAEMGASLLGSGVRPVPPSDGARRLAEASGLTRREESVLALVADGLTNAQIAARMALSTKTVANYVSVVLTKLGARDRADAARVVHGMGPAPGASTDAPRRGDAGG